MLGRLARNLAQTGSRAISTSSARAGLIPTNTQATLAQEGFKTEHVSSVDDPTKIASTDHHWEHAFTGPHTEDNRAFTYFVLGGGRFAYASLARMAVVNILGTLSPSANVVAMAKVEADISKVEEGTAVTVMWRGKPVFIRHRTPAEIKIAEDTEMSELKDPQTDAERVKDPRYMVLVGICTHLGCVPVNKMGDYDGWYCPCHGSHYDLSGRIRRGPAPLNLEVPAYKFLSSKTILLGEN